MDDRVNCWLACLRCHDVVELILAAPINERGRLSAYPMMQSRYDHWARNPGCHGQDVHAAYASRVSPREYATARPYVVAREVA